jgi:hypothetical protein
MTPAMSTKRAATTHHEAGHAVMSFALGLRFMYIVIWGDDDGEVIPECARCESCVEYFEKNNPTTDFHAERIQDDIRREIAVAVAGEIAEALFTNEPTMINTDEVAADRCRARRCACFLHIWSGSPSCRWTEPCAISDPFLTAMRSGVEQLLRDPKTWSAVTALATHLENASHPRTSWDDAIDVIEKSGAKFGSISVASLPPAP